MKRERSWRPEFGAQAVPTEWLAVVVLFTEKGTGRGAGLGDKIEDMCDAYAKWT